jgi:hypothetical protein
MAISSPFDIISYATRKLGGQTVQSFLDDTEEARVSAQIYEIARDQELESYPWNFTTQTIELNRLVDPPVDPNWSFQYTLPVNLTRVLYAMDASGVPRKWRLESNRILSNEQRVLLKYQGVVPESEFPTYFANLLASRMFYELAEPLIGDAGTISRAFQEYTLMQRKARQIDAQQNLNEPLINARTSPWNRSRLTGSGGMQW